MKYLLCFFLVLPFIILGQSEEPKPITRAVVIGVAKYKNLPESMQLEYAKADAKSFYDFTLKGGFGEVKKENISYLADEEADYGQIRRAILQALFAKPQVEGDKTILYFAGHGDMQSEFNLPFLLAHDAPANKDYHLDGAWEIEDLQRNVVRAANTGRKVILIIDACRSGKIITKMGAKNALEYLSNEWENVIKVVSCGPDQSSLESTKWGGGHGVFTYYLLKALNGLADKDKDKKIRVFELNEYMSQTVREETNFRQIPKCTGSDTKVVVEISTESVGLEDNSKKKGNEKARGLVSVKENPHFQEDDEPVIPGLRKGNGAFDLAFYQAMKTGYFGDDDFKRAKSFVLDTSVFQNIFLKTEYLENKYLGGDSVLAASNTGKFRLQSLRENYPIDSGVFSTEKVELASLSNNAVFWKNFQSKALFSKDLFTGRNTKIKWKDPSYTLRKIAASPSGRFLVLIGGSNAIILYDVEKNEEVFRKTKTWFYLPEISFSKNEDAFFLYSAHKDQPVQYFNSWNSGNFQMRVIGKFSKTFEEGHLLSFYLVEEDSALLMVMKEKTDTLFWNRTKKGTISKTPLDPDMLKIIGSQGWVKSVNDLSSNYDSLPVFTFEKGTHIYFNPKSFVFNHNNRFKYFELIEKPKLSAEEILKQWNPNTAAKENASALLASVFEKEGSNILDQYIASGKLKSDSGLIKKSLRSFQKAMFWYGDSSMSANAKKKFYLLRGLELSLSQEKIKKDSAIFYFQALKTWYPRASFPLNALAELLNAGSESEKAKDLLTRALQLTPKWTVPRHNLGKSHLVEGSLELARQQLEEMVSRPDFTAESGIQLVEIYRRCGDTRRAREIMKRTRNQFPNDPDVGVKFAELFADQGIYWKAWKELFKIHKLLPFYPPMVLSIVENPGRASDKWYFLKESIKRNPENMSLKFNAVLFLLNPKFPQLPKDEIPDLLESLEKSGWKPELVTILKYTYEDYQKKLKNKAIEYSFLNKVDIDKWKYQDLYDYSKCLFKNNFKNQAISISETIVQKKPDEVAHLQNLIQQYLVLKKPEKAKIILERAKKVLSNTYRQDSCPSRKIKELEIHISELNKNNAQDVSQAAFNDDIFSALDSLLSLRDKCKLISSESYLATFLDLNNKASKSYLTGRRNKDGVGLYQIKAASNLQLKIAETKILSYNGETQKAEKTLKELSASEPENGIIAKLQYDSEPVLSNKRKKLKSRYLINAYNSTGSGKASAINVAGSSIITDPVDEEHQLNIPFQVEKVFHPSFEVSPILCVIRESGEKQLLSQKSLKQVFTGDFEVVSEVLVGTSKKSSGHSGVHNLLAIVKVKKGWGILKSNGIWFLEPKFSNIFSHEFGSNLYFELWDGDNVGIANAFGKISIPVDYSGFSGIDQKRGQFLKGSEKYCLSFQTGKNIGSECIVQKVETASFDFPPTDYSTEYPFGMRVAKYFNLFGYVNKSERFVINPQYAAAGDFMDVDGKIMAWVNNGVMSGFIDQKGKYLIPMEYLETTFQFSPYPIDGSMVNLLIAQNKLRLYGIIKSDNTPIIPFMYDDIQFLTVFKGKTVFAGKTGDQYNLYDMENNQLMNQSFERIKLVGPGLFELNNESETYQFDLSTNLLTEIIEKK